MLIPSIDLQNGHVVQLVQGERLADSGSLNARQVKIPGILVDCVGGF